MCNRRLVICLILLFNAIIGCKKESEKGKLILGNWKLIALTSDIPYDWNNDGIMETNLYNVFSNCEKDNLLQLKEGAVGEARCNCSGTTPIQWWKNGGDAPPTRMEIEASTWDCIFTGKFEVVSVDKRKLIIRKNIFLRPGQFTFTLSRL